MASIASVIPWTWGLEMAIAIFIFLTGYSIMSTMELDQKGGEYED